jgi:hypothetical protein
MYVCMYVCMCVCVPAYYSSIHLLTIEIKMNE